MSKQDEDELVHFRGSQLKRSDLPAGYDESEVTPIEQWFAENKNREPEHKAVMGPRAMRREKLTNE